MDAHPFELSGDDWRELRELLDQALELPADARAAWLDALDVPSLRHRDRLRALLAHAPSPGSTALFETLPKVDTDEPSAVPGAAGVPVQVGPYRLLGPLGEGGMATVWLAERTDVLQGRRVALKLPHGAWRRAGLAERLARERDILATLEHPHIARLYDAGIADDGQPYLALEYIDGQRIDTYCDAYGLDIKPRLVLFIQVAQAVAHAHARLVVHRDLKPSNILVTADAQVHLVDFGIARLLAQGADEDSDLTRETGRPLTPEYAAPEQFAGGPISTAADIYSLGVVLFELLTGMRPYRLRRTSPGALEDSVRHAEPPRPSEVAGDPKRRRVLRGDLDTIVLKALKQSPQDRYATVDAMVDDILRSLSARPVLARPDGRGYRLRRFIARNKLLMGASGLLAASLLAGTVVSLWQAGRAVAEARRAEAVKEFIVGLISDADPAAGHGKPLEAVELLRRARTRIGQIDPERADLRVELFDVTGEALLNLGDPGAAEAVLRQAGDEAARHLGPRHPLRLQAQLLLAQALGERDAAGEMRAVLDPLLSSLRADAANDAVAMVRSLGLVARMEIASGRDQAAVKAAREAFELARRRLGDRDAVTVAASNILAEAEEYAFESPESALSATDRGLRFAEAAHAGEPAHPQVVRMLEIHAMALADAGQDQPAVAQWRRALDGARRAYGPGSVVEGLIHGNMVPALRRLGEVRQALESADSAMALLQGRLRGDSRTRALHLTYRAAAWVAARRGAEAWADFDQAHAILQRLQGPTSPEALDARMGRGHAAAMQGHFAEALADLDFVMQASQRGFPGSVHYVLYTQAAVLRLKGDVVAAREMQRESIARTPTNLMTPTLLMRRLPELGLAELALGHRAEALEAFQRALEMMERSQTAVPPARAEVWQGIAQVHLAEGRAAEALALMRKVDAFWREFDPGHAAAREAVQWLSRCEAAVKSPSPAPLRRRPGARVAGPSA